MSIKTSTPADRNFLEHIHTIFPGNHRQAAFQVVRYGQMMRTIHSLPTQFQIYGKVIAITMEAASPGWLRRLGFNLIRLHQLRDLRVGDESDVALE